MSEIFQRIYNGILEGRDVSDIARNAIFLLASDTNTFSPTWHALGFVHCKLLQIDQGTLRIHIWPKKLRNDSEQKYKIHDHIFSLKSFVICGEITNKTYQLIASSDTGEPNYSLFHVEYLDSGSRLCPGEEGFLPSLIDEEVVPRTKIYHVERGVFHESAVSENKLVATLVATYNHCTGMPKMLGAFNSQGDIFREKINFPNHKWRELLVTVLHEMTTDLNRT
ncbi:hypothetical protein [Stutzerimonas zhaodongensis]|uniref:hypothetical protein n=1 Tax=Stutzerimonas zhaodongensis TaxID=1176257 RepID=UPI0011C48184|nr:hypothetical protein [Stutzerimonas zhaodongensis]MCQ4316276.1 hypothetical protein [Stutzerimonas zhaodongensis]